MNDIIQARRARNDITVPIPRHGHSSHQLGHSSPLPPFLLFSLGSQWAHAQFLQGVDTAPLLAYAPSSPGPTFALAIPFQKHWGLFSRVAKPSLPELEHFRQHVVGNPFAPRRAETRQRWPTSGHGTIEHSRKKRNRAQRSTNGNISCPHCNCDLYCKTFDTTPSKFRSPAVQLSNGMLVHHFLRCRDHLSVWFYRRGVRHYQVYYGNKAHNLWNHIHTARAASGKPGGHDSKTQILSHFCALHGLDNRYNLDLSGHESRSASGVRTSHENRRSLEARQRRHQLRNDKRRQSRRDYRSWIRSVLEGGKFTLAHSRRPLKRVNNSPAQLRRAYFNQRFHPTIGSRASLFPAVFAAPPGPPPVVAPVQ